LEFLLTVGFVHGNLGRQLTSPNPRRGRMKFQKLVPLLMAFLPASAVMAAVSLKGTGSSLAAPLYFQWIGDRAQEQPDVKIKYEVKDSDEGVKKALGHGSDFASTDSPLTDSEQQKTMRRTILHLPVALEAVAITYNLPGVPTGLKLTPGVLSDIFLGTIKKWNNIAIKELNPGTNLLDMDIRVLHRGEESSLHDLFPGYLAALDPQWMTKREKEKKLHWPAGENAKGNDKVLEKMRLWPGVIAAVDLPFAAQKGLPVAALKNSAGRFVTPSVDSLEATASDFPNLPEDFQVNLTRSRAKGAYPLCAFSYLLVYQDYLRVYHDHKKGQALIDFLNWVFADGQKKESDLSYGPLPEAFLSQIKDKLQTIKY
jgi:phosphate transport system substrate-binding protein